MTEPEQNNDLRSLDIPELHRAILREQFEPSEG